MSAKFKFQLVFLFGILAAAIYFFPGTKNNFVSLPKMPAKKTVYYKWQDEQGVWHMSDQAPEGIAAQRLEANPNANIIQSVEPAAQEPETDAQPQQPDSHAPSTPLEYLSRAQQTVRDAEQARDLLNQRQQELDSIVSGKEQ